MKIYKIMMALSCITYTNVYICMLELRYTKESKETHFAIMNARYKYAKTIKEKDALKLRILNDQSTDQKTRLESFLAAWKSYVQTNLPNFNHETAQNQEIICLKFIDDFLKQLTQL